MSQAEKLKGMKPELTVDLTLYPTERGGRKSPIRPGWGSPCTVKGEIENSRDCYDGWPQLGDATMAPGESRRVGYVFLLGQEAAAYFSAADKFYIWEGRIIGEAKIVSP